MEGIHPKRRQKLTYLVEPQLDKRDALELLRDVQEFGLEREDVSRTQAWTRMTLNDGTVVELNADWSPDTPDLPVMRLVAESGRKVPPPPPDVLEERAARSAATEDVRRAASDR